MTSPARQDNEQPKRRHRPRTGMGRYVTDQELVDYLGVPKDTIMPFIRTMDRDRKSGFPPKDPNFGDRRSLPAVEAWLDRYEARKMGPSRRTP